MERPDRTLELPRLWKFLLWTEVPLTLGAVAFWLIAPASYLRGLLGDDPVCNEHARPLLYAYAGVVATMVGWQYARLLSRPSIDKRGFLVFQECLLLGDVWIVGQQLFAMATGAPSSPSNVTAMALAAIWGLVRARLLWRFR